VEHISIVLCKLLTHLNSLEMRKIILIQSFWIISMQLSAQSNSENTLKVVNTALITIEIPSAEQTVYRTENPLNRMIEKNKFVTDEKMQNPSSLPKENLVPEKSVGPKKHKKIV